KIINTHCTKNTAHASNHMRPNKPQSQGHLTHTQPTRTPHKHAAHINKTKLAHYRVLKQHAHNQSSQITDCLRRLGINAVFFPPLFVVFSQRGALSVALTGDKST
ncbi:hypothetical protein, partial [Corynebacterium ciconiae]|uniref:hypothetical protein n=1 Tax=Corynebacterium ciconiae TaxID=227319 RepID=UPI001AD833C6